MHVIRDAAPADAAVIADLGARTFRQTYAPDTRPAALEAFVAASFAPAIQAAELRDPRNRFFLAEADGTAVGYALVRDEPPPVPAPGAHPLLLSQIYLEHEYQGRGLGAALMKRCIDNARERAADVLWLGVWERNARAISFYERWGFTRIGDAPFEFGHETHRDLLFALAL